MANFVVTRAAIVDGAFHISLAVEIPTTTCGLCKTAFKHEVDVEEFEQRLRSFGDINGAFKLPNYELWQHIWNGKSQPEYATALVCPTCAAPINEAKKLNAQNEREAHAEIVARMSSEWQKGTKPKAGVP